MKAKSFFYVCAGVFLLALSYHLGARSAGAQAGAMVTGFSTDAVLNGAGDVPAGSFFAMTPNGDIYGRYYYPGNNGPLHYVGNFWDSAPVPAQHESWGQIKSRYRGQPKSDREP